MPLNAALPTFTFFKMINCPACEHFNDMFFDQLINDTEVRRVVNLDQVTFGRKGDNDYTLETQYPDFDINYAPYLWLSAPYDEKAGYHLDTQTMFNRELNKRRNGVEFPFLRNTTYQGLKQWILENAAHLGGAGQRSQFKRMRRR